MIKSNQKRVTINLSKSEFYLRAWLIFLLWLITYEKKNTKMITVLMADGYKKANDFVY